MAAAVVKPTDKPFWQAASPNPRAMWLLPVPLLPTAPPVALNGRRGRHHHQSAAASTFMREPCEIAIPDAVA